MSHDTSKQLPFDFTALEREGAAFEHWFFHNSRDANAIR